MFSFLSGVLGLSLGWSSNVTDYMLSWWDTDQYVQYFHQMALFAIPTQMILEFW